MDPPFTKGERIGFGTFGAVFHAKLWNHPCAAKTFYEGKRHASLVLQEIRLLERLRHRHIIQFYRQHHYEDQLYIVTDVAEGGSLKHAIESRQLVWPIQRRLANEISRALEYLHGEGILHRDLKSANIVLTKHQEVKLCDFGHAIDIRNGASTPNDPGRGTVRWLAPELLSDMPHHSTKSDVYALGVVLWEMVAGCTQPFKMRSEDEVMMLVKGGVREPVPKKIDADFRRLIKMCWHHDCASRPEASKIIPAEVELVPKVIVPKSVCLSVSFDGSESAVVEDPVRSVSTHLTGSTEDVGREQVDIGGEQVDPFIECMRQAEADDTNAQVALGEMYEMGRGVPKSNIEALLWYQQAAARGHIKAQCHVGRFRRLGQGCPQNDEQALIWYTKAAAQGDPEAQTKLGWMYQHGRGPMQSSTRAVFWYRQAAEQGYPEAQDRLGYMYQCGQGVRNSDSIAISWYHKAIEHEYPNAQFHLGCMYYYGRGVERDDALAADLFERASLQGNAFAQLELGKLLEKRGAQHDTVKAVSWYLKAAEQGLTEAQTILGVMYADGHSSGVEKSDEMAVAWLQKAASQGSTIAEYHLGLMLLSGRGIQQDMGKAASWLLLAAKSNYSKAQYELGRLYLHGRGVARNDKEAVFWITSAADKEHPIAQYELGRLYHHGRGDVIQKDMDTAMLWYSRAAKLGHKVALIHLTSMLRQNGKHEVVTVL